MPAPLASAPARMDAGSAINETSSNDDDAIFTILM